MYFWYLLVVLSVFLFLHGFFPISKSANNVNNGGPPNHINNITFHPRTYNSDIEKTVLIIIDALRLDFVDSQYMPLTTRITKENGCFNTIRVETPTVTLPRIKALTTGSVPQFIDLVLNLASTEILRDSIIHSLVKQEKKVVFYGDDTWLKLFPNFFSRYEGTSSFFVRDFHEVDDNVTRNVNMELEKNDWDMMILHYLGLDHIGHVYGPFSSHIPNKLTEMDEIIYSIYSKLTEKNGKVLLIITGDHGMRDSGGHGGSSYFETHVPLLAVGLECANETLLQIDIPVNLAVLLGLNIPSTSIGQIRSTLLPISLEKYLFALRYNNLHLLEKVNLCDDYLLLATKFHEMYIKSSDESYAYKAIDFYKNCSNSISNYLIKSSVKQNLNSLIISILIMLNTLTFLICKLTTGKHEMSFKTIEYMTYLIIIFVHLFFSTNIYPFILIIILVFFLLSNLTQYIKVIRIYQTSKNTLKLLILATIIHPLTFFSSSFVEEEHQFWYFFCNILIVYTCLSKIKFLKDLFVCLSLLGAFRFLRTINSTGDKWANYPDFSDWLLKSSNHYYYQLFFISGLIATFLTTVLLMKGRIKTNIFNFIILLLVFFFKNGNSENVLFGQLIWLSILSHTIFFYDCPKVQSWILISVLLLKPYNVLLVAYCILASVAFFKTYQRTTEITFCHFWIGNMLYFAQGHSNSLASVDVSVGYIGLSEYQPLFVISQVLCHTYSLPVLCHFLLLRDKNVDSFKVWTILFSIRLYIMIITCIITIIFRDHLFVWSVFTPKLFIEAIHIIFLFIELSIYFSFKQFKSLAAMIKLYLLQ